MRFRDPLDLHVDHSMANQQLLRSTDPDLYYHLQAVDQLPGGLLTYEVLRKRAERLGNLEVFDAKIKVLANQIKALDKTTVY